MNTKTGKKSNQEILIGDTASDELSDEMLDKVAGGLSLASGVIINSFSSKFVKFEPDTAITLDSLSLKIPTV